jgi:hypothetical protein
MITHKRLVDITYIASSAGAIFTQPAGKTTYLKLLMLHNTNTTTETVTLYCVPDNAGSVGTAAVANQTYKLGLAPDETVQIAFGGSGLIFHDTNETLQAVTTTASKVTVHAYGAQE